MGISILLSAFFSGTETAFVSANLMKIKIWIRQKIRGASTALHFLEEPERFLMTTLIGNNLAMVVASTLMVYIMENRFIFSIQNPWRGFIITGMSAFLLLTFGEIIPKSLCSDQATAVAIRAASPLKLLYYVLYPLIYITRILTGWMMQISGINQEQSRQVFSRKDMDRLVKEGGKAGVVEKDEQNLISRFLLRGDFKVRDVMVPRTEIIAVKKTDSIADVKKIFQDTGYSRLPVMGENIDDIVGVITAKDMILKKPRRITQIIREILFIPESRKIASFLKEIQTKSPDMAIVIDEYGGTSGLVTLEDMVEEFFGDIQDEFDENVSLYRKVTPMQIDVKARIEIHELNAQHPLMIPEGEYHTLAGFLMEKMGRIPRRGEKLDMGNYTITVLSATRRMVHWVRIHMKNPA